MGVNVWLLAVSLILAIVGLSWSIVQMQSTRRLESALRQAGAPDRWQAWWILRLRRVHRSVLPALVFLLALDLLFRAFQVPHGLPPQSQHEFQQGLDKIRAEMERSLLLAAGLQVILGATCYVIWGRGGR